MNFYKEQQRISLDHFRKLVALTVEYVEYRYASGDTGFGVVKEVHHVGNVFSLYVHQGISGTNKVTISAAGNTCANQDRVTSDMRDLQDVVDEITEVLERPWDDVLRRAYYSSATMADLQDVLDDFQFETEL